MFPGLPVLILGSSLDWKMCPIKMGGMNGINKDYSDNTGSTISYTYLTKTRKLDLLFLFVGQWGEEPTNWSHNFSFEGW